MIRIVLISVHPQETEILHLAFKQRGFAVFISPPAASNFLQLLQYRPDFVFLEIPANYVDQLGLLRLLRKNDRFAKTPVIAYGSSSASQILGDVNAAGGTGFLQRPLKLNSLFEVMKKSAPNIDLQATAATANKSADDLKKEDIAKLLDPNVETRIKLEAMVKHTGKLFSFPFVIMKILDLAENANSGAEDLAKVINSDASLCATILKVANSVHFASQKEIGSAREAIIRIGFNEVKAIAMGLELMKLLPDRETFGFNRMDFWTYTLGRAIIAEKLAKHLRLPDPTIAFLGGLLSDFSVLLLDAFYVELFDSLLHKIASDGISFEDACLSILGFHPAEYVSRLLEQWRLPKDLVAAIRAQDKFFLREEEKAPNTLRLLTDCLAVSVVLARAGGFGHGCDDTIEPVPDGFLREMRMPVGVSPSFYDPIDTSLLNYAGFFGIDKKLLPKKAEDPATLPPLLFVRLGKRFLDPHYLYFSRDWHITLTRNKSEVEQALAAGKYRAVILEFAPGGAEAECKEVMQRFASVTTDEDKKIPVLGLWLDEHLPTIPDGIKAKWIQQKGDLRQMLQALEILLV